MRALVLSRRAEADLREIWTWTCEHFGATQADRYLDQLDEDLQACAADPDVGARRDSVRPGYRSMRMRSHVAFYAITDEKIVIQRILHASMDPSRHL
jgi:toxin ParE1/3/4